MGGGAVRAADDSWVLTLECWRCGNVTYTREEAGQKFTVVIKREDGLSTTYETVEVVADTICDDSSPIVLKKDGEVVAKFFENVVR